MAINAYEINSFTGISDYEDRGTKGAFKFGKNLDVRKSVDSLSAGQDLVEEGLLDYSRSPSASTSPSSSTSPSLSPSTTASASASTSPSSSGSASQSASTGISPSTSLSPSASASPSASVSPSRSLSPSPSPSGSLTSVFADLIKWFVKCSDGFLYGFGNTGYVYRRDSDGVWTRSYKDELGEIKGAIEKPSDTGRTYLEWCTDKHIKRKEIPGRNDWNDVEIVAGNLTSASSHMMVQIGGAAYICNGPFIAMHGYDDSWTNEALDLIPGNLARTILERNGRAIIGTYKASDPNKGINAAIDTEVPLAQVGDDGEIYFANMTDSIPVKRFPGGGKVNPGGVVNKIEQVNFFDWEQTALSWVDKQSVGNMAIFAVYDGDSGKCGIYSYGRENKNKPFVLNLDHEIDVDELGALTQVGDTTIVSYMDGSLFGVKATDTNNKAEATYEGLDFKVPMKKPEEITTWHYVELYMAPIDSGQWVEFWYKMNKTGDFTRAKTADGQTRFNTADAKKAVFRINAQGDIYEPRVVIHPNGNTSPEIYRIRSYFS